MGAAKKLNDKTEVALRDLVKTLTDDEKRKLLYWSEHALMIKNDKSLDRLSKLKELSKIKHFDILKLVLTKTGLILKNAAWTNQSWARRLGAAGLIAGASVGGGVGIASMGIGIGVPMLLVTTAGGLVLGVLIDEIKKEMKD